MISKIRELLERRDFGGIKRLLKTLHYRDIARIIERLDPVHKLLIFENLDLDVAADTLLELDEFSLKVILAKLDRPELTKLVSEMDSDEATDIVATMTPRRRREVLRAIPKQTSKEVAELLKYPENTAGGRMSLDFLSLYTTDTVASSLRKIKRMREDIPKRAIFFVTDKNKRLLGWVHLRDLVFSSPRKLIKSILRPLKAKVYTMDDQEDVARIAMKYELSLVPVVDDLGILKGVITYDDIMDVIEEENTEDILRFGGMGEIESAFAPPAKSAMRRLPWLYINLITAFLAAAVVGVFQNTIRAMVTLAVVMPIVAGMGGNAGIQTLTLIIRSIALGEVELSDAKRVLFKELRVGLLTGTAVGALTGFIAWVFHAPLILAPLVFVSLIINMGIACGMGVAIPFLLKRLGLDPSLASGVILTTFTDCIGFFVLLGLASLALKIF